MNKSKLRTTATNDGSPFQRSKSEHTCKIGSAVKRRNGLSKYWCETHRAPAWDANGRPLAKCAKADSQTVLDHQTLNLNLSDYPGGIAIWGALPAVYDTYGRGYDEGIHVHARRETGGKKVIDRTYKMVTVNDPSYLFGRSVEISEAAAVSYVASTIFGVNLKSLTCTHCGELHHDDDYFAVVPHLKHQCQACGREFFDVERSVSNPTMVVKSLLEDAVTQREVVRPNRPLRISQAHDCPLGIQIWPSNQAVIWTSSKPEEEGIHVHGYSETGKRIVDDTFDHVEIDGIILDETQARYYMAQMSLPFLKDKVCTLSCPGCGNLHFDIEKPMTPHHVHECELCGIVFQTPGNHNVVSNPFVRTLELLKENRKR